MLTPVEIEKQITEVANDLEQATYEYRDLSDRAARGEVAHKVAFAKKLLLAEGAVEIRKAQATVATENELLEREISAALAASQKELLTTLRARLDSLRTLAANVRSQT